MKKRDWFVSIVAGLVLAILAIGFGLPSNIFAPPSVRAEGKAGEAVRLMLRSHTTWQTLRAEVTTQWLNAKNEDQVFYSTFEIENPNRAHVGILAGNGSSSIEWFAEGDSIYEVNNLEKTYYAIKQPDPAQVLQMIPGDIESVDGETVFRHPLAMIIPSPAADYIYPTGLAQRPGGYDLVGDESVAGRKVLVIDYQNRNDQGQITMMARYWVDQQTGLILQANVFSTNPERFGDLIETTIFTYIEFDRPIELTHFTPTLIGLEKVDSQWPLINP